MPTNLGMARSMHCCRTATRSVSAAATLSNVPAKPLRKESGS
ncbi:hypothetical protein ABZ490_43800 [Streptomyces sp. NPDC005811]